MIDKPAAVQHLLTGLAVLALLVAVGGWLRQGAFPDPAAILPPLLQEPLQTDTDAEPFAFTYRGEAYAVHPVADYEIWGLVVAHNDAEGFGDIYHDEDSVDTKDLCVLFGSVLRSDAYHQVEFESGAFTCYWRYPAGVGFDHSKLSNNHLVTDQPDIRAEIARVRVGDQVHVRGQLVNYHPAGRPQLRRKTSTTRRDTGAHACEVVFVEDLEILDRGTPGAYLASSVGFWALVVVLLAKLALFLASVRDPRRG